jgi:hypothetical protein
MNIELNVKDPLIRGPLALYPLFSPSPSAPPYLTGPEAERMGVLRVAEQPGGATVPQLAIHNTGALPLLLLEGETLVGAKQNRTLDFSILIAPGATVAAPVSCVEAGRWGAPRASSRSLRHAPSDLRRVKTAALADVRRAAGKQAELWSRIDAYHSELSTSSHTGALEDAFTTRAGDVTNLVHGTAPLPDQQGVAVAIGGTVRGLDSFDKPETLAAYWDGLTAGYALDAIGATAADAPSLGAVGVLVARLHAADATETPNPGLGRTSILRGDGVVGHALEWDGVRVHTTAFVDETPPTNVASATTGRRARPIRRQRGYTY